MRKHQKIGKYGEEKNEYYKWHIDQRDVYWKGKAAEEKMSVIINKEAVMTGIKRKIFKR